MTGRSGDPLEARVITVVFTRPSSVVKAHIPSSTNKKSESIVWMVNAEVGRLDEKLKKGKWPLICLFLLM